MRDLDEVFRGLAQSRFRQRFHLGSRERTYLESRGLETVMAHAADFIEQRLVPAEPVNDGRQTPMRGHPAFIAQHATATCCRGCLQKWHGIEEHRELDAAQKRHVLAAIERWILAQLLPTGSGSR